MCNYFTIGLAKCETLYYNSYMTIYHTYVILESTSYPAMSVVAGENMKGRAAHRLIRFSREKKWIVKSSKYS